MELNLARIGRRKVGGSADVGIRVSRMDFGILLLIILRFCYDFMRTMPVFMFEMEDLNFYMFAD